MNTLTEVLKISKSVKKISLYSRPEEIVDLNNKDKYEVVSIRSMYPKFGLCVLVKEIKNENEEVNDCLTCTDLYDKVNCYCCPANEQNERKEE